MIYQNKNDWLKSPSKRVSLLGMSGLGKTRLSNILQSKFQWFHYSVDYRIGTRYLGEHIVDNFKREAMKNTFLRELLLSDSIYISSNLTFNDLSPLSSYLGSPGDKNLGGMELELYIRRQKQHREAEIFSVLDTKKFIEKSITIYGYNNFVCDTSGSICEIVDPLNPSDPLLNHLSSNTLILLIKGTTNHNQELVKRFTKDPKPIYYNESFLREKWESYKKLNKVPDHKVEPEKFALFCFEDLLEHRAPIYDKIAQNWGITLQENEVSKVRDEEDFVDLISSNLENNCNKKD